jgi:hypothetical protein
MWVAWLHVQEVHISSQLESDVSVLCCWFVVFRHYLNLQNLVSSTKYIFTPMVFHTKFKVFHSNKLPMPFTTWLAFFLFIRNWINKSKSIDFSTQSNYNFQTQESINILKTKQKKTKITISRLAMLIRMNCGRNEDTK